MPSFPPTGIRSEPATARRFVARGILMAVIWLGFNGTDWSSWMVGGPMVLAAAWLSIRLLPANTWHWSVGEAIRFGGYFLRESLRGGWGVARHALSAPLVISPGLLFYRIHLPPGPSRLFFCSAISLLPGTAVVAIAESTICVHVLDDSASVEEELRGLERRVGALFALELMREKGPAA